MATNPPRDYFTVEKKVLRFSGISLTDNVSTKYKIYSFLLLLYTPYTYSVFAIIELFKPRPLEDFALRLVFNTCAILDAGKTTVLMLHREKLTKLLDTLHSGIFAPDYTRGGEIEDELVVDCMNSNKHIRLGYLFSVTLMVSFTIVATIVKRLKSNDHLYWEPGFGLFSVVNVTYSPNYEIVSLVQDVAYCFGACQFVSFDLMFGNIVSHLCVQFKILQNSLRRSVENSCKEMVKYEQENGGGLTSHHEIDVTNIQLIYLRKNLKRMVKHHLAIIDLVNDMEEIFSVVFLIMYLVNMIVLCFALYMVTILPLTDSKMVTFTGTLLTINFQSFIICYRCNDVAIHSQAVGIAAYEAAFVGCPISFQRDLAFIARRSLNPTTITAGNFFVITLATFMKTQQAAFSYFMAVHQRRNLKP